ncbi:MAG TPA: PAS domain S-box protein [Methanothermobacter sp.]|nr:sensory transduction histidine kinase [Methanothermobacter sp. MT-2]HHW04992.1 PAS domain S-box protein [Methanothermobacter sp.]HOK72496.1 PAS domain S-box protein [Methanothermobacter sp.]HOL69441.1 PAS domain S-box protein [Methanothermobacter sp.]HPQ03983.1 PAS domain S-box protein [Methanothermobacter sp.]
MFDIFLVEDAGLEASDLKEKLESLGFTVNVASEIENVKEFKPDIVLIYTTPERMIEWSVKDLTVPFTFLIDFKDKAVFTGPHCCIDKPLNLEEIKQCTHFVFNKIILEEERYKNLFKYIDTCVAVYQPVDNGKDFIIKDFNRAAEQTEQVKKENILGKRVTEIFPGVEDFGLLEVFKRVYKTGNPEHFPISYYKDDRISGWRDNFVYKLPSGEIVAVYKDVTRQKQLEEELKEKEQLYRSIFDNTGSATAIIEEDTTISLCNKEFEELTGYSKEEIEGKKSWTKFVVEEDLEKMKRYHKLRRMDLSLAPRNYTFKLRDRWGKIRDIQLTIGMIPGTGKSVASLVDVTELRNAERKIRESREKYRAVVETAPNGVLIFDKFGRVVEVNKRALEISGFRKEELIGKDIKELAPRVRIDLVEIFDLFERAIKGEKIKEKVRSFTNLKGEKIYYIAYPSILRKNSEIMGLSLIIEDVTERYKAEKKIKESLMEKETLLREIHHRVKNNMQIIQSLLSLQAARMKEEETQRLLQECQGRIRAMSMVHEHLYQSETIAKINIKEYIEKLLEDLVILYKAKIKKKLKIEKIQLDLDTAIPLGLIINELATNSIKYAFPNGKGTITIKLTKQKNKIKLTIADDGIGLPENIKPEKTETLGLKLVNILTKQLNGKITHKTKPGTKFKITFPQNLKN